MIHEEFISLIESAASRLPSDCEELPTGIRSDDGFYSVIYIFPDGSDPDKCIQQVKDTFKSSGFNPLSPYEAYTENHVWLTTHTTLSSAYR